MAILSEMPEGITVNILARVGRCHYPKISTVNKHFRHLMASQQISRERLKLGVAETALYALIGFHPNVVLRWYTLDTRNIDSFLLGRISVPPALPVGCAVVTIGSYLYIMGGYIYFPPQRSRTPRLTHFDCVSHKSETTLPYMARARAHAAAGVIDGKIYVIGGCERECANFVEVYDFKTWSPVHPLNAYPILDTEYVAYVVMREKIYILGLRGCCSYDPRQNLWGSSIYMDELYLYWHKACCVVDDRLYCLGARRELLVYDPQMEMPVYFRPVLGVELPSGIFYLLSDIGYLPYNVGYDECKMANLGGKLVILGVSQVMSSDPVCYVVWLIEIALEGRENGDIWGNVESVKPVLLSRDSPAIELCRTVTV